MHAEIMLLIILIVANMCDRYAKIRKNQIVTGVVLGFAAIAANIFSGRVGNFDVIVSYIDTPPILAGFFFGPVAGIVAGTIAALERALSPLWGVGTLTWFSCSVGTLCCSLLAVALGKWAFGGKRPAVLPAFIAAALCELSHITLFFFLEQKNLSMTLETVLEALPPMAIGSGIAAAVMSVCCRSWKGLRANFLTPAALGLLLFTVGFAVVSLSSEKVAKAKSEALLDYSVDDLQLTTDDTLNVFLHYIARNMVAEIGSVRASSQKKILELADHYGIDEVNVFNRDGKNACSTDPEISRSGADMNDSEKGREFMVLTNGVDKFYGQQFRHGIHNKDVVRKYIGVPFEGGDGFIQLGYDIRRLEKDFNDFFLGALTEWQIGECGYILTVSPETAHIAASPFGHDEALGKTLADIGISDSEITDTTGKTTYVRNLFGERCYLRNLIFGNWRFLIVVPFVEFHGAAMTSTFVTGGILFVLFSVFGWGLIKIYSAKKKLDEMRAAEDQRRAEDLATARSIQMSALPLVFPPFPRDFTIDIYASMTPAREVGGDFYDFYYIGPNRIAFLVADVSGKGIPAAMFMMKAKTTIKSCVFANQDIAEAMTAANATLSQNNDAGMFVTCWFGVLHTDTGRLEYVNAGHNAPYIRRADGSLETLDSVSGLFLAGMDDTVYGKFETKLEKDDLVYLFTDGVTEANDIVGNMFEERRLEAVLKGSGSAEYISPENICGYVANAMSAFVGVAPQFDDITMLALTYRGNPERAVCKQPAVTDSMPKIASFVEASLKKYGCTGDVASDIMVAVDEVMTNIVSYSGSPDVETVFEHADNPSVIRLSFIDSGKEYNPLSHTDPDVTLGVDERSIGGLGILMVKNLMDEVYYEHKDGKNVLVLRKAVMS